MFPIYLGDLRFFGPVPLLPISTPRRLCYRLRHAGPQQRIHCHSSRAEDSRRAFCRAVGGLQTSLSAIPVQPDPDSALAAFRRRPHHDLHLADRRPRCSPALPYPAGSRVQPGQPASCPPPPPAFTRPSCPERAAALPLAGDPAADFHVPDGPAIAL